MGLDLTGVRAKLTRSQIHAQTIKDEVRAYFERHPYSLIEKANPEYTKFSLILRINEPAPFERWGLIIGDYLNNLRSALDYLVYTIAAHEAAPNEPRFKGKLMFPITDSRVEFDEAVAKRLLLGDISHPVRAVIEQFQPYNRPHAVSRPC